MPPLYRAYSEDVSRDSNMAYSGPSVSLNDHACVGDSPDGRSDTSTQLQDLIHLNTSSAGPHENNAIVRPIPPGLRLQEHASLFTLSLIADRCRTQALEYINSKHHVDERLPESHPDVCNLAEQLFSETKKDLSRAGIISSELANRSLTDLQPLVADFDIRLQGIAARQVRGMSVQQNYRAITFSSESSDLSRALIQKRRLDQDLEKEKDYKAKGSSSESSNLIEGLVQRHAELDLKVLHQKLDPSLLALLSLKASVPVAQSAYRREFTEVSKLGQGAFGSVYKVQNNFDGAVSAIKRVIISPFDLQQRLVSISMAFNDKLAEVRNLAKLNHDNIVRYQHCWIELEEMSGAVGGNDFASSDWSEDSRVETEESSSIAVSQSVSTLSAPLENADFDNLASQFDNLKFNNGLEDLTDELDEALDEPKYLDDDHVIFEYSQSSATEVISNEKAIQRYNRPFVPTIRAILYIKMTAYPLTLESLLSADTLTTTPPKPFPRHCFHILPTVRLLLVLISGLQYIHRKNIIHQDLKPANIFLSFLEPGEPPTPAFVDTTACPECKNKSNTSPPLYIAPHIGDFGMIRDLSAPQQQEKQEQAHKPLNTHPHGTPFYIPPPSPKHLSKDKNTLPPNTKHTKEIICPKRDCYALGAIALELLCKFNSSSERIHVFTQLRETDTFPAKVEESPIGECVKGLLDRERGERWDLERAVGFLREVERGMEREMRGGEGGGGVVNVWDEDRDLEFGIGVKVAN